MSAARGERHSNAKLCQADVLEIFARAQAGENKTWLATEFKISKALVDHIKRRSAWRWLLRDIKSIEFNIKDDIFEIKNIFKEES